jgi:hypothetical protein
MTKFYDVRTTEGEVLMRAPLDIVARVLNLHPAAEERIVHCCDVLDDSCELFDNGRGRFPRFVSSVWVNATPVNEYPK